VIRHLTASGVVVSADDRVLLVEHRKLGCWIYPGGHVCPDEDPAEAVVREIAEETGITCQIVAESRFSHPGTTVLPVPFTILVLDVPADTGIGPHQHIDMVYVLAPRTGLLVPQDEEVSRCAWVPVADVAEFDTPPELPALIAKAAAYARALGAPAYRLTRRCVM
jgi:8-oxo-dGTP diphosphatase